MKQTNWIKELDNNDIESHDVESISLNGIYNLIKKKINILKVDIEGAEYDFLMNSNIDNIDFILIEINLFNKDSETEKKFINYIEKYFNLYYKHKRDYSFINKNLNLNEFNFFEKKDLLE